MHENLPPLPKPEGVVHDGLRGILTFQRAPLTAHQSLFCSTMQVFTAQQMQQYASEARRTALEAVRSELERRYQAAWEAWKVRFEGSHAEGQVDALDAAEGFVNELIGDKA